MPLGLDSWGNPHLLSSTRALPDMTIMSRGASRVKTWSGCRTSKDMSFAKGTRLSRRSPYLVDSSGSKDGQRGCEVWFARKYPDGQTFVEPEWVVIHHESDRVMSILVHSLAAKFFVAPVHAPLRRREDQSLSWFSFGVISSFWSCRSWGCYFP